MVLLYTLLNTLQYSKTLRFFVRACIVKSSVLTQQIIQDSGIVIVADRCREQMRLRAVGQIDSGGHWRVSEVRSLTCEFASFFSFSVAEIFKESKNLREYVTVQ